MKRWPRSSNQVIKEEVNHGGYSPETIVPEKECFQRIIFNRKDPSSCLAQESFQILRS